MHRRHVHAKKLQKIYADRQKALEDEYYNEDVSGPDGENTQKLDFLKGNPYKGLYEKVIASNGVLAESKSDIFEDSSLFKPIPYSYILPNEISPSQSISTLKAPSVEISYPFEYPGKLDFLVSNPVASNSNLSSRIKIVRNTNLQMAVLLLHPHANTAGMQYLIASILRDNKIKVTSTGAYLTSSIRKQLTFQKHFSTLKSFAIDRPANSIIFTVAELNLLTSKLSLVLPEDSEDRSRLLLNFRELCEYLEVSESIAVKLCTADRSGLGILTERIRHGLYVSAIDSLCADSLSENNDLKERLKLKLSSTVFVINGFYISLKNTYDPPDYNVSEGLVTTREENLFDNNQYLSVHYMAIEWDGHSFSWRRLLDDVIGHEDPKCASTNSIRGRAYREWASLGLSKQPNSVYHNCVNVSDSAFVGMAERLLWQPNMNLASDEVSQSKLYTFHCINNTNTFISWRRSYMRRD